MSNMIDITLANLAGGAAEEKFQAELVKVLANIADPNTSPTARRAISLQIVIDPDNKRQVGEVIIASSAKLAGDEPFKSQMFFIKDKKGKTVAVQSNMQQSALFDEAAITTEGAKPETETEPEETPKVTNIRRKAKND